MPLLSPEHEVDIYTCAWMSQPRWILRQSWCGERSEGNSIGHVKGPFLMHYSPLWRPDLSHTGPPEAHTACQPPLWGSMRMTLEEGCSAAPTACCSHDRTPREQGATCAATRSLPAKKKKMQCNSCNAHSDSTTWHRYCWPIAVVLGVKRRVINAAHTADSADWDQHENPRFVVAFVSVKCPQTHGG